jgi:hypothetical protein
VTKIKTTGISVNLRQSPTFDKDNVVTLLNGGTSFDNAERVGDWWRLSLFLHNSVVREVIPPSIPNVPYRSQVGSLGSDAERPNDCGPACVAMLLSHRGMTSSIKAMADKYDPTHDGTTPDELVGMAHDHGVDLSVNLLSSTDQYPPAPFIALVKYRFDRERVWAKNFWGWHWIVYLGLKDGEIVCHDPLFPLFPRANGEYVRYSLSDWQNSFVAYGNTNVRFCVSFFPKLSVKSIYRKVRIRNATIKSDPLPVDYLK